MTDRMIDATLGMTVTVDTDVTIEGDHLLDILIIIGTKNIALYYEGLFVIYGLPQ